MKRNCRLLPTDELNALAVAAADPANTADRARLVEAVWPLIRALAKRRQRSFEHGDELCQECVVHLLNLLPAFDPAKGAITTYMGYAMQRAYREQNCRMNPVIKLPEKTSKSDEAQAILRDAQRRTWFASPLDDLHRRDMPASRDHSHWEWFAQVQNRFEVYLLTCDPRDASLLRRRMAGATYEDMAVVYGITKQGVQQRTARAIERAQHALKESSA